MLITTTLNIHNKISNNKYLLLLIHIYIAIVAEQSFTTIQSYVISSKTFL